MICGGPIWGNPPYDDILWYMVVSKNGGSKSVNLPYEKTWENLCFWDMLLRNSLPWLAGTMHHVSYIVQVCCDAEWRNSLPAKCVHIYICVDIYIYGAAIKIVQDHCSIAEAPLSEVCMKHCRAIGPPPKTNNGTKHRKAIWPQKKR